MKSDKLFVLCINQNKSLKNYIITSSSRYSKIIKTNTIFINNGYYIYELRKQ